MDQNYICNACNGSGQQRCDECDGSGKHFDYEKQKIKNCKRCQGEGVIGECPICGGDGIDHIEKTANKLDMSEDQENIYSEVEEEDVSYSGVIEKPFDPKKIDITTKQMTLDLILKRLKNDEVDLKTFFQRGMDLWNKTQQSRLIESILIRLPLPAFYFDGSDDNKWLVVDGLQRLSSFKNFILEKDPKKQLKLENLEYLTQYNGFTYNKLPRNLQRRIEEHEITVYIINEGTPNEVKFNLFKRINTGGLVLTSQEIRQALNQGIPAKFITELSELPEFTTYKINPKRMLDKDFVNRFLAFYLFSYENYKPDLDDFLNKAMAHIKNLKEHERTEIKTNFKKSMIRAKELFGDFAFRKRYDIKLKKKSIINKALFEVWSVTLSKISDNEYENIKNKKEYLNNDFIQIMNTDKDFEKSISTATGDIRNVNKRYKTILSLIEKYK